MDIKGDFYRFSRLYKRAITALLITVFLFCLLGRAHADPPSEDR